MKVFKKILSCMFAVCMGIFSCFCLFGCSATQEPIENQDIAAMEMVIKTAKKLRESASFMGEDAEEVVKSVKLVSAKAKVLDYMSAENFQKGVGFICCEISYTWGGMTETSYCSARFSNWKNLTNYSSNAESDWEGFIVDGDYEWANINERNVNSAYKKYLKTGKY